MAQIECLVDSDKKDGLAVIFIHGLNGDARETWMRNKTDESTLWPRWLASDTDCSVWLLAYDAKLSNWQNNAMPLPDQGDSVLETLSTEEGLRNRPLLLIGHSMGGLVIKTLISHGRTKGVARYKNVVSRIHGVVFIATPHNGSQMATLAKYLSVVLRTNPQVGDMKIHDAHIRSLHHQFLAYFNEPDTNVAVRTFAETKGVLIGKRFLRLNLGPTKLVVDPSSSEPHVPNEIAIPLPEDHISICKLENKESQLYKSLLNFIREGLPPRCQLLQSRGYDFVGERIHSDRLPTVKGAFFGRIDELKLLNDAWAGNGNRIVQFIAPGGTGKTKLLRHWLDHTAGIDALLAWSFYSQGSSENKQVSATPFFSHAFEKLGSTRTSFATDEDKGEYLAELLLVKRCVLVLDGLEPLQHVGRGMQGELKDRAIRQLLKSLASHNNGLCIITTRIAVHELCDRAHVVRYDLQNLTPDDGVLLLQSLGVTGSAAELHKAVQEYGCHALALSLLGNVLRLRHQGNVLKRDTLKALPVDAKGSKESRHAFKVMQAYEEWFAGETELALLYLLGLFDHPISLEVLQVLCAAQIPHLTADIEEDAWLEALAALREEHHLLAQQDGQNGQMDNLDCHPLIREYFGQQLQNRLSDAWQQAHKTLYNYYKALPSKELPDTLEEMQPLFNAVAHGCAAGLYQRALDEVCWPRIQRDDEHYMTNKLGAFSDDLAIAAHFFTTPWSTIAVGLTERDKALILNWAGFGLRALGRLREALEPMQTGMEIQIKNQDWKNAANVAGNLSELQLSLGEVAKAQAISQRSVIFADQSGDARARVAFYATHADALHQAGETAAALALFREAELLLQKYLPSLPLLCSLSGFCYCDLLLSQGDTAEVLVRAEQTLEFMLTHNLLLDIGLDQLTLGHAYLQQAAEDLPPKAASTLRFAPILAEEQAQVSRSLSLAAEWLEKAVASLRKAGAQDHLPRGLLIRAVLSRFTGDFSRAAQDLQEVFEIVEPSGMRLFMTDYHLEIARLLLAQQKKIEAQTHIEMAETLIRQTGYHRRDAELVELQKQLVS
ncbi:pimeloyl-ACP methyl ester carboxylesterase/tetratricopeptide (TPR) repeat protein [Rheinheimera pacifica]|uniref:PGAP1-like alpha/beta domain-containing protein n=1 Tax=Rheinheimera pacifica TaxID=173990 RepID=UPI00285B9B2E|nr:hypothetical protein [Rheinheimera pacifica]MDR6983163.1 pimeloyl-ACP methyl ester carboxylesterase/tetratricopeptide (TPR) repeat protein [Rheinheimera pacifica]